VVAHLPFCGEEIVMVRASIEPPPALLPIADAQRPVTSAEDVALDVVANVVADVTETFTLVDPNVGVSTNDDCEIDAIVPNVPPNPRPPSCPPRLRPGPVDPVGAGFGVAPPAPGPPPKPLLGGAPLPKPPRGLAHPDVLVTDTLVAVIAVGVAPVVSRALATETHSPVVNDDNETTEIFENLVNEPHATAVVPLADCTDALDSETETILPATPTKLTASCGWFEPFDDGVPEVELEPPHAATMIAVKASPATDSTLRSVPMSFTPQCVDWGESCRPRCRVDPEADTDGNRHHDRTQGGSG
jgi:hypothetical protein